MIIIQLSYGTVHHRLCLPAGSFSVGRKNCVIPLPDHPSVSRHHATLIVAPTPAAELGNILFRQCVFIADVSKHGTTVNGCLLNPNQRERQIAEGDTVTFGTAATMRVSYYPVVVLQTVDLDTLTVTTARLGGILARATIPPADLVAAKLSPYGMYCPTNAVDVRHNELHLESIVCGYVFVTPSFLDALYTTLCEAPGMTLSCLPDPISYMPVIEDELFGDVYRAPRGAFSPEEWLLSRPHCLPIFRSRFFILLSDNDEETLRCEKSIVLAEGKTIVMSPTEILAWKPPFEKDGATLPLIGLLPEEFAHGLNVSVIVSRQLYQVFLETLPNIGITDAALGAMQKLWKVGCTLVTVENIRLAIAAGDATLYLTPPSAGVTNVKFVNLRDSSEASSDHDSDATIDGLSSFCISANEVRAQSPVASHRNLQRDINYDAVLTDAERATSKDLYDEWLRFRQTAKPTPSTKQRKQHSTIDFASRFADEVLPIFRTKVISIADQVMSSGGDISREDASFLDVAHQRIANFLEWVEANRLQSTGEELARSIIQCIETTVLSAHRFTP